MAGQPRDDASHEYRVDEVVVSYFQAVDRGESPDALAYVEQHPDVASELMQFFADRDLFRQMADALSPHEAAGTKPRSGPNVPKFGCDQDAAEPARPMRYVADYELLEEIARGGMGVVYKARQMTLNRVVALKMILAGQLASAGEVKRFRVEAEAAAQLDHPGIVPIYEVGEHEGQHYFSMGYVEGQSLAARVAEGPLPPREAAELVCAVAEAVHYAHRKGVIHRDLKPGNILLPQRRGVSGGVVSGNGGTTHPLPLTPYQPKITDFGLAKRVEGDSSLTGSGQILGTPSYMPPVQAAGKLDQVGVASDVYSLGAVLYCLLTGRPPFQSASVIDTLLQVLEQEPLPPRQLNSTVPRDLETICLKCLRKEPDRRYASAFELAADLRRQLAGEPIHARRTGVAERAMKRIKRRPAVALLVLTLVGSSLFGTLFALERQDAERAAGLVNELLHSEINDVPGILERMQDYWSWVEPILKAKDREDLDDAGARLRVALALLSVDESKVVYLKDQLLAATKEEFPVVRDLLRPRATEASLIGPLWAAAGDEKRAAQERFQGACALAALAPTDERWHEISDFVAGHLVTLKPSELAAWRTALRPAAKQLLQSLAAIYRNSTAGELPRTFAAATLADYAANDSDALFELLADAEPFQFVRIFNVLKAKPEQAADRCARELAERPAADAGEDEKESLGKRQANAAVALLKLGEAAKAWPLLRHGPDPRAASYFIHWLGPLQAVGRLLHEKLFETVGAPHDATPLAATPFEKALFDPDTSLRRTLLLALGEFDEAQLPQPERGRLAEKLWELYQLDPDSGVHSSVDWLLRKWEANDGAREQLKARFRRVDGELAGSSGGTLAGRRWYVNGQGQTMVVVPGPVRSLMGAPADERGRYDDEAQQAVSLDYTFAIASRETTVEQIT
ncbi:MAG TPA: serine/threonine-protein kinase, partial [Pirellulales bacterium]|nr:serine/threonine-protein kinase [Pirellulales bacterium]